MEQSQQENKKPLYRSVAGVSGLVNDPTSIHDPAKNKFH